MWTELKDRRDKLAGVHQEFEVTRATKSAHGTQTSVLQIVLDMSQGKWREKSISGSGSSLKVFDGNDVLSMEEGGDEYVRLKRRSKDADPVPSPYLSADADWSKAREMERRPCGLPDRKDVCVVLDVPLKPWTRYHNSPKGSTTMLAGTARILADTETGLVLVLRTFETLQGERSGFQSDVSYALKRFSYGTPADAGLFKLPSDDLREVKELSRSGGTRTGSRRS